jgi:uncharacterized protein (TIRG00374 family)
LKRPAIWQTLIGLAVSIFFLWWSLRNVEWAEVASAMAQARLGPVLLAVVVATSTFGLRVFRWQLLLRTEDGRPAPGLLLWHAVAMGFMANNILPLRVGEVVRAVSASQLSGVRLSAAVASLAVERLFDALTVVSLMGLGLLLAGIPPDTKIVGVQLGGVVVVLGLLVAAGLAASGLVLAFPAPMERLIRRLSPSPRLGERLVGLLEGVRQGLSALKSPSRMLGVVLWSLAIWLLTGLAFYIMYAAFAIPVDLAGALLMQGLIMVGIAAPSTPGYLGVFEAPVVAVLSLYNVSSSVAVSYAFTYHFTTFIPITLLGLWSLARTGLGLKEIQRSAG